MPHPHNALPDKVKRVVDEVLIEQGFENAEVNTVLFSLKGENYLGVIYGLQAAISGKRIELIVKLAPGDESMRAEFPVGEIYEREFFVYEQVWPVYEKLQRKFGIPNEQIIKYPKCYKAHHEYLNETLVLEDMKASGFRIFNRFKKLDFDHARLSLEAMGKYHALSFALKKEDPEKFAYFIENMTEFLFKIDGPPEEKEKTGAFLSFSLSKAVESLNSPELKAKLKQYGKNIYDHIAEGVKPGSVSVIAHGDCWSNNMMYRYKDGKPIEIRLLDYQIGRYCSPVIDIMYFIFCCTDQDLRKKHYNHMLKVYYEALRDHLAYFSLEVEDCYPWSVFMTDLKKHSGYPLGAAVNNVLLFSTDASNAMNMEEYNKEMDLSGLPMFKTRPSEAYRYKINGLVEDFVRYGYL